MALLDSLQLSLLVSFSLIAFSSFSQGVKGHEFKGNDLLIKRASYFPLPTSKRGEFRYDYILVGGGTAACPLAATLSQKFRVLVLERGGVPFNNPNVTYMRNFHIGIADISPTSASQAFVSTEGVVNARARALGGGSCINAGFYSRASQRFIEQAGWDPKLVEESYEWVERQIVHQPNPSQWQLDFRDALLGIGVKPNNGYTFEHLMGTKFGGSIFDRYGRRHSAAELLMGADPNRMTVLVHATVQKIIFDTSGRRPKTVGVAFKDEKGSYHEAFLESNERSEVISCSGAMGSPQMLILSGIGPEENLKRLNISMILKNEMVGKEMVDNPTSSVVVPTNRTMPKSLIQTVGITMNGLYIESSSGFGRSRNTIHRHSLNESAPVIDESFNGSMIAGKVAYPLSRGQLSVVSADPNENPSVTFNYFSDPRDLSLCVETVKIAEKIANSNEILKHVGYDELPLERLLNESLQQNNNLAPKSPNNNTKSLEQFCKDSVTTIWHYHGGCHVGKVVDKELKVIGVDRLRVIDGSTFDESPGTNPQATVMMLGRYMGITITRERTRAAGSK